MVKATNNLSIPADENPSKLFYRVTHPTLTFLTVVVWTDELLIVSIQFVTITAAMTTRATSDEGGVFTGMRLTRPHFALNLTLLTTTMFALVLRRCKHLSIKVSSPAVFTTLGFTDRAT